VHRSEGLTQVEDHRVLLKFRACEGAVRGLAAIQPSGRSRCLKRLVAVAVMVHVVCVPTSAALAKLSCTMTCRKKLADCRGATCAAFHGKARRTCLDRCYRSIECPMGDAPRPPGAAPLGTLAYVVTECRTSNGHLSGGQKLVVRHGDCDPITIKPAEFAYPDGGVPYGFDVCDPFGASRAGYVALAAAPFQRIGVSPDGSLVVFEVTNRFSALEKADVKPLPLGIPEGIYRVRADGADLQRLGPPSAQNSSPRLVTLLLNIFVSACSPSPVSDTDLSFALDPFFRFSPDGRLVVFTDLDSTGTVQLGLLDIEAKNPGGRQLVTRLPSSGPQTNALCDASSCDAFPPTTCPYFVNNDRLAFYSFTNVDGSHPEGGVFTIGRNGEHQKAFDIPTRQVADVSKATPNFEIVGPGRSLGVLVTGQPGQPPSKEIFSFQRRPLFLQLTNFGSFDLNLDFQMRDTRDIVFHAPVDPRGQTPSPNCQLFAVDQFAGNIRQLTKLRAPNEGPVPFGALPSCLGLSGNNCSVLQAEQDATTGTILFYSSCDPFQTNPDGGQIFAMRPDGTGLWQVTRAHGRISSRQGLPSCSSLQDVNASTSVVLPGPFRSATTGSVCLGAALGRTCNGSLIPPGAACCGNGVVDKGEACDQSSLANGCPTGESCDESCTACAVRCGDGVVGPGESCDGPTSCPSGETCNSTCTACGSGLCVPTSPDTCNAGLHGCSQPCDNNTPSSACVSSVGGAFVCVQEQCTVRTCNSSADCNSGEVCFTEGCCPALGASASASVDRWR
jgi:hypothetical protein